MAKRYPALILCCAVVALTGCGSSHSPTTPRATVTGPVSSGVFTTDLNALCQNAKSASGASLAKAAAALGKALPQFKAITAPTAQQAGYSEFIADLEALAAAAKSGNSAAAQREAAKLGAVARQLHVSGCTL